MFVTAIKSLAFFATLMDRCVGDRRSENKKTDAAVFERVGESTGPLDAARFPGGRVRLHV